MSRYNLPSEIKPIYKLIETLGRRHNYVTVFDDYLSSLVNFFTVPNQAGFGTDCFKKYSEEERKLFSDLLHETVSIYNVMINQNDYAWYDPFGELYMYISSVSKAQGMGQFFTPASLVDMMVQMNCSEDLTGKGIRVNDPSCGSGRMLIAFHAAHPGNYVYGDDLDLMCCKMSLINLLFHGAEGEIVWHDTLKWDYIKGWKVNHLIRATGLPTIIEITKEESNLMRALQVEKELKPSLKLPSENQNKEDKSALQLTIF